MKQRSEATGREFIWSSLDGEEPIFLLHSEGRPVGRLRYQRQAGLRSPVEWEDRRWSFW